MYTTVIHVSSVAACFHFLLTIVGAHVGSIAEEMHVGVHTHNHTHRPTHTHTRIITYKRSH